MKNGMLVHSYTDPDMPAALEYIKMLISEGVVDQEFLSNTTNSLHDLKAYYGKAGIIYTDFPRFTFTGNVKLWKSINPEAEWVLLSPPIGPGGQFAGAWDESTAKFGMFAIPKEVEKDPAKLQKIFDIMNYVSSPEGSQLVAYGEKHRHYEINNGKLEINIELRGKEISWLYQFAGRNELEYLLNVGYPEDVVTFIEHIPRIKSYNGYPRLPQNFDLTRMQRYAEEEMVKFIYGLRPLDEYDLLVNTLKEEYNLSLIISSTEEQLRKLHLSE